MKKIYLLGTQKNFLFTFSALVLFVILSACQKDEFANLSGTSWGPDFAAPVINTRLTIGDILATKDTLGLIQEDPVTKRLTLVYKSTIFSVSTNDLIKLESQKASSTLALPSSVTNVGVIPITYEYTNTTEDTITFTNSDSIEIEHINIKTGTLAISVKNDFNFDGTLKVTFPSLEKNGIPASTTIPLNKNGSTSGSLDVSSYVMDMSLGGTKQNSIPIKYAYTIQLTAGGTISPTEALNLEIEFKDLDFTLIDGYFGHFSPFEKDKVESINLSVFKKYLNGSLFLKNPKIEMFIKNEFGVPLEIGIPIFKGTNGNNQTVNLTGPLLPGPFTINSPSYSEIGQSKETTITFDTTTSNLSDFISNSPLSVDYSLEANTNPQGKAPGVKNFVTDKSKADVDVNIEIPLWGAAKNFALQDTFPFSLGSPDSELNYEKLTFKVNLENGFPVDLKMQLYFYKVDSVNPSNITYTVVDSLIPHNNNILNSCTVDANGQIISATKSSNTFELVKDRVTKIQNANKIIFKAVMNTTNGGNTAVRFLSTSYLNVRLGMRAKLNIPIGNDKN